MPNETSPASSLPYTTCPYFNISFPTSGVIHLEINRPEKLNAWIEEMWLALPPLFTRMTTDPSIRAVILSGAGPRAFTTGLDVTAASSGMLLQENQSAFASTGDNDAPPPDGARIATRMRAHISEFQACLTAVAECPKPVVAVLHGYCLGLGIDLSLCADVRICTHDAKFAVKEVDIGIAADIGTLTRLPKAVGNGSWVKDVCISGRGFGAEEAVRVGFCSWVGKKGLGAEEGKREAVGEAVRWAGVVAGKSPVAVQGTKAILDYSIDHTVRDGLHYTAVWNSAMLQTRDTTEAISAGMQKRPPRFAKL